MQFLCTIKKVASLNPWRLNAKWLTDLTVTKPKYVWIPISLHILRAHGQGKHAYVGLWVKYSLGESSCVSKIPPLMPKKLRITVSVFLSTLQLTALLLKKFRLRLHCYTQLFRFVLYSWFGSAWEFVRKQIGLNCSTKIYSFISWIETHIGKHAECEHWNHKVNGSFFRGRTTK